MTVIASRKEYTKRNGLLELFFNNKKICSLKAFSIHIARELAPINSEKPKRRIAGTLISEETLPLKDGYFEIRVTKPNQYKDIFSKVEILFQGYSADCLEKDHSYTFVASSFLEDQLIKGEI